MADKTISYTLLYGNINRELRVDIIFQLDNSEKYKTVKDVSPTHTRIHPAYALSISEGFGKNRLFIPAQRYWSFIDVYTKSVKLVSNSMNDLFPNATLNEFDMDNKALEIFRVEKAISTNGYSVLPCIWVNETSETRAAISISDAKGGIVRIPLEDAIVLSTILKKVDPIQYQMSCMNLLGRIQ